MIILLVDDEREEREGVSYLIRKFRYPLEIVQAASAREALDILEKQKIDILFTDVKMPVMSGLELARKVRENDKEIKIIFLAIWRDVLYTDSDKKCAVWCGRIGFISSACDGIALS